MTERKTRGASRGFFYTLSPVWGRRGGNPVASSMKKPGPLGTGFWKAKSWGTVLKQALPLFIKEARSGVGPSYVKTCIHLAHSFTGLGHLLRG